MSEKKSTDPIADLKPEGWDWFSQANEPLQTKREKESGLSQEDFEMHFSKALSGKSGEIVMSYLASYVTSMPGFDPSQGANASNSGFYRSGMQALVQHIHVMKTKGAKGK